MFAASEEPDVKRLIHTTNPRESKSIIEAQDLDESQSRLAMILNQPHPPVVVRYCVNPAHVKVLDEESKAEVISMIEDRYTLPTRPGSY
ncbi:hypothetical protein Bca4012_074212 [Brassica carinata]